MPTRQDITQTIIDLMPAHRQLDTETAQKIWYRNLRRDGGLRLTPQGYRDLQDAGLQSWNLAVDWRDIPRKVLLELDRRLAWPYFVDVSGRRLIMFGAREAMLATIYGDLRHWLSRLERRQTEA